MEIKVPSGKYVLAVSGGIDSMVLLDLLAKVANVELVVAHFNHGIRHDSDLDEALVKDVANSLGLTYETGSASLGSDVSEAAARHARYEFLEAVMRQHNADKIITAHHQDDWIETVLINILRGTGRQGVSAILNNPKVLRPLISVPKARLARYALQNGLRWHDDSTNQHQDYLRNYLRTSVLPKLTSLKRQELLRNLDKVAEINKKLDIQLATLSHKSHEKLNRQEFSNLPTEVGQELMVLLLRQLGVKDYDRQTVARLSLAVKTARPNTTHPVKDSAYLDVSRDLAVFVTP